MRRAAVSVPIILAVLLTTAAEAAEERIAFSKKKGVEVFATQHGATWCAKELTLRLTVSATTTLQPSGVGEFIQKLAPVLDKECATAESATITAVDQEGDQFAAPLLARKSDGWRATEIATPATEVATSAQAAEPVAPTPAQPAKPATAAADHPQTVAEASAPVLAAIIGDAPPPGIVTPPATTPPAATPPVPESPAPALESAAAPTAATAPAAAPAASAPTIPEPPQFMGYEAAMLRYLRDHPGKESEEQYIHWWASYRFGKEYHSKRNQEFKLQPVLLKAGADLAENIARADPDLVTVVIETQFGDYDFKTERFPISLTPGTIRIQKSGYDWSKRQDMPSYFNLEIPELELISGLPMPSSQAEEFANKRIVRYSNSIDRNILIAAHLKAPASGLKPDGNTTVELASATLYGDQELKEPLHLISQAEVESVRTAREAEKAALAKAEAERQAELLRQQAEQQRQQEELQAKLRREEEERQAELQRQQMLAERDQWIQSLSLASTSTRLANWIGEGGLDDQKRLDNLRSARGSALLTGNALPVTLLIQAQDSGREQVATTWPGMLQVTVPSGQAELESSRWYLVSGLLSVPDQSTLSPASLAAQTVYACVQPQCAEAADATAIVDRKLAALEGTK